MRFSQSRMYKKRAIYKKKKPGQKSQKDASLKPARMITKPIGGDKNGGQRTVRINRLVSIGTVNFPDPDRCYCFWFSLA